MDVFKTLILDTPDSLDNISGVLPVVNGGTGADNASDARVNLLPDYTGNANKVLSLNGTATDVEWTSNGAGDVAGPASSTDNAVVRFDSTTGKVIQNSGVTISDANLLTADALSINNNTTLGSSNTDTVTFNARIASEFTPATDNTYDLGRTGHEWRDLYLDGTANIDSLIADTADINGGTIDGTTIGATTPAAGTFSQVNSTGAIIATGAGSFGDDTDITGDLTVTGGGSFTGNVGVGTAAPADKLSLSTPNGTQTQLSLEQVGQAYWWQRVPASTNALAIGQGTSAGSEFMRIDSAGRVGVGTTAPSTFRTKVLEVADTNNAGIVVNGDATNAYASLRLTNSGTSGWDLNYNFPNVGDLGFFDIGAADTRMVIDDSGNVGIGSTAPARKLTIVGAADQTMTIGNDGPSMSLTNDASNPNAAATTGLLALATSAGQYGLNAGELMVSTIGANRGNIIVNANYFGGGASRDVILQPSSGNVGVGTSSPNSKLTILGDDEETAAINTATATTLEVAGNGSSTNSGGAIVFSANSGSWKFAAIKSLAISGDGNTVGDLAFSTRNATGDSTLTERMRITYDGKIGINDLTPSYQLDVNGTGRFTSTVRFDGATQNYNGAYDIFRSGAGYFRHRVADQTLSFGVTNTAGTVHYPIVMAASADVLIFNNEEGEMARFDTSGNFGIGLAGPSYQLQLSTDSAAKPSTNTWTIASDARIKTETGEYTKGLDAVLSLRPITYRYNGKAGMVDDGEDKISIIAQEAVNAFPECVGSYMTKLDEDDEEETEVLNWNGHALTFALVNSIKELAARLEALENN